MTWSEPVVVAGPSGYILVDVALGTAAFRVDKDAQVRCLLYLIKHLHEFTTMPSGLDAGIIPLAWHNFGELRPSLGLYVRAGYSVRSQHIPDNFELMDKLQAYIDGIGVQRLLELAQAEDLHPMTWQDVLDRSERNRTTPPDS